MRHYRKNYTKTKQEKKEAKIKLWHRNGTFHFSAMTPVRAGINLSIQCLVTLLCFAVHCKIKSLYLCFYTVILHLYLCSSDKNILLIISITNSQTWTQPSEPSWLLSVIDSSCACVRPQRLYSRCRLWLMQALKTCLDTTGDQILSKLLLKGKTSTNLLVNLGNNDSLHVSFYLIQCERPVKWSVCKPNRESRGVNRQSERWDTIKTSLYKVW